MYCGSGTLDNTRINYGDSLSPMLKICLHGRFSWHIRTSGLTSASLVPNPCMAFRRASASRLGLDENDDEADDDDDQHSTSQ